MFGWWRLKLQVVCFCSAASVNLQCSHVESHWIIMELFSQAAVDTEGKTLWLSTVYHSEVKISEGSKGLRTDLSIYSTGS